MLFLLASICASVAVSVLLKFARRRGVAIEQAIAVNYLVCIALTLLLLKPSLNREALLQGWGLFAALGVLLPSVFIFMGRAIEHIGIVKADAAQRLSLFLPIIAAFTLFGDQLTMVKAIGIGLAFAALLCLIATGERREGRHVFVWVAGVWFGYGIIDILFKQMAKSGVAFSSTLLVAFVIAAVVIFAWLLVRGTRFNVASLAGGVLLGALNFTNIFTYVRAHQVMSSNPSLVFTGMNVGVITLASVLGWTVFGERATPRNLLGVVLAVLSIVTLFYGTMVLGALR
ncbi:MAG: DMT family transporter [Cardiobacteriaceae bacterium]|nr:DMT family transporter [Cardiobacteriaceae bacterium]